MSLSPGTLFRSLKWSPSLVLPDAHWLRLRLRLRPPVWGSWEPEPRRQSGSGHIGVREVSGDMQTPSPVNMESWTLTTPSCLLKPAQHEVQNVRTGTFKDEDWNNKYCCIICYMYCCIFQVSCCWLCCCCVITVEMLSVFISLLCLVTGESGLVSWERRSGGQ